jgi:hypothetical protein
MKKRRLLVEQPMGKRYCNECELWRVSTVFGRECSLFDAPLISNSRGHKRCEQCLEAERLAEGLEAELSIARSLLHPELEWRLYGPNGALIASQRPDAGADPLSLDAAHLAATGPNDGEVLVAVGDGAQSQFPEVTR